MSVHKKASVCIIIITIEQFVLKPIFIPTDTFASVE